MAEVEPADPLVLVTGASGYIATHIVQQLQQQGYRVRGTVRSLKNEAKIKPLRNLCPDAKAPLELVEADLTQDEGWFEAVNGCTFVLHTASPFPSENPKDENELIRPAVDGTLNVLKAVRKAGCVKRVVLTSSVASVSGGFVGGEKVNTEEDWTDTNAKDTIPYVKSKTLAEKAAWDFLNEIPEEERFELAVVNPSYVMGPVLCGAFTTSMEICKRLMECAMPALPKLNFAIVDVRDVATAHICAMKVPEAVGKRHILNADTIWMAEIAGIIEKEFKPQGYSIPTMTVPKVFVWMNSFIDPTIKLLLPSIGKVTKLQNSRMKNVLGIKPRNLNDTLLDMCYSMVEAGYIKKTNKYKPKDRN